MAWLGAVAWVLVTAWGICGPAEGSGGMVAATLFTDGLPRSWAAGIAGVLALVTGAALVELARMLGHVQADALFSTAVTRHFRRFACLLTIAAVLRLVLPPVATLLSAWRPGGHVSVQLVFSGDDVFAVLLAAVFFFVARLFDEAARLEDDQRSIV
ncbi:DUF2975 domain-containing protein [Dyella jiangningensis]|uniref:DUF2975 domain-containing protein n=1 Tax=Dyella jiangningensis TaxID=1379159 RepID=A0A328P473_9GAMM|nr:DUF2975 domain-containing protein [Dyella jiangningensis]RAO76113.1 hypothetical protein CA260_12370 [Dyella jiangningensis]